jgi:hypothetical protein
MARKQRSAHAQLDEHRQRVASEGTRFRELQEQQVQAEAELERIDDTIASAYASEDEGEIVEARKAKEEAAAKVEDFEHRTTGASLRAARAREELVTFTRNHGRDLLDEREQTALVALRTKPSAPGPSSAERRRVPPARAQKTGPPTEAPVVPIVVPNAAKPTPTRPNGFPLQAAFRGLPAVLIRSPVCLPCRRSRVRIPSAALGKPKSPAFALSARSDGRAAAPHRRT